MATINGTSGDETLTGTSSDDTINGDAGNDLVWGNEGNDSIDAGSGNDTAWAGDGQDTVQGGDGDDLIGGDAGNDSIDGGEGHDTIWGGSGDDTIRGDGGDDEIGADEGQDSVDGGAGNDTIYGSAGDDTLTGGSGDDTFNFTTGDGNDTITDFDLSDTDGDGFTNDQFEVSALSGGSGAGGAVRAYDVVVSDDGFGNAVLTFPDGESVTLQGIAPSQMNTAPQMFASGIPCFTPGIKIETKNGPVAVEHLEVGDLVATLDRGCQPVRWIGRRTLNKVDLEKWPNLRPVTIRKGTLGNAETLSVSPQHAFVVNNQLVRAKHLAEMLDDTVAWYNHQVEMVTYIHFLCDQHEIVFAEGCATESLYPGHIALRSMECSALVELLAVFPELAVGLDSNRRGDIPYGQPARNYMRGRAIRQTREAIMAHTATPEFQPAR